MKDQERGYYKKYRIERMDGGTDEGCKHEFCDFFVLDLQHDKHAIRALHRYIYSCQYEYPQLAKDLRELLEKIEGPYEEPI